MGGHFDDTSGLPVGACEAKGAEVFDQPNDAQFAIQPDHVNGKAHPERMDAIARAQPQRFMRGKRGPTQQPTQAFQRSIRQDKVFSQANSSSSMIKL